LAGGLLQRLVINLTGIAIASSLAANLSVGILCLRDISAYDGHVNSVLLGWYRIDFNSISDLDNDVSPPSHWRPPQSLLDGRPNVAIQL